MPSPHQSNSPGRPGSHEGSAVVPRSQNGWPPKTVTVNAEARTYLSRRLVTAPKAVEALCPRKVHTAEPGEAPWPSPKIPNQNAPDRALS